MTIQDIKLETHEIIKNIHKRRFDYNGEIIADLACSAFNPLSVIYACAVCPDLPAFIKIYIDNMPPTHNTLHFPPEDK